MIIDTHCHLDYPQFDEDRNAMLTRAAAQGVEGLILIGTDPQSWAATRELCADASGRWRTAGIHPNSVEDRWDSQLEQALRAEAAAGELVGIGETGVDLFRSNSSKRLQMEAFDAHLQLAREIGLPIVIHQRDAEEEVLEVLDNHPSVSGVLHCFGGDWSFAQKCLACGLHLGIGGVATFKRADATRDAVRQAPLERLVLETDAPYLAPQARRGKRNEPAFLPYVVETIAAARGVSTLEIEAATTRNAVALFGLQI